MQFLPSPRRRAGRSGLPAWPIRWAAVLSETLQARLDRFLHPAGPKKKQIVVCGYPRGGTSLLYNMLSATLDGFRFAEFERSAGATLWRYGNWASKLPLDILRVQTFPQLNIHGKQIYVIAVLRDLRDVITSIHPRIPDRYFCGYLFHWGKPLPSVFCREPRLRQGKDNGVKAVHDAIEAARSIKGITLLTVRYEDLVADPDSLQQYLADHMGVQFTRRFSQFHTCPDRHAFRYEGLRRAADQGLVRENSAVTSTRAGKWRKAEHRDRICQEFTDHPELFQYLQEYGYEADDAWFEHYGSSRAT